MARKTYKVFVGALDVLRDDDPVVHRHVARVQQRVVLVDGIDHPARPSESLVIYRFLSGPPCRNVLLLYLLWSGTCGRTRGNNEDLLSLALSPDSSTATAAAASSSSSRVSSPGGIFIIDRIETE